MTKYAIHPLMNPNDRTAIRMHSPIVDALDNLGAFNFVDEGHLGRMLNKNRELKIHYVLSQNPKLLDNVLLAVEVTTDMASITENAITVDGVRYQVVGAVGVPKGNKIAGQNFDTLRTDLNIELNQASEVGDYFVSKEHYNHVKHIYSGRMVRSMNEHQDASVKPLNRQFPGLEKNKPLHLGFYYSGTDFRTPTLDISESVVPLNRHNDPMPGSVWMMTQEADGLWYSKLLNVSRLNPNSFNLTEKMNTRFIQDILGGIETLLNESLSETERLAGWDAIHDRLFYELDEKGERKKFINFNKSKDGGDDIIKIHEGPNTTPTEVVMENGLSLQERAQAVLEALWVSKANLRFQVSPNLALDQTYMDDLLQAEILTTDLARTHNLNASFDLFLYEIGRAHV